MNKFYNLIAFLVVVVFLSSCVSTQRPYHSAGVSAGNVKTDPVIATVDVDDSEKVRGSGQATYFLFFRVSGDNRYASNIDYDAVVLDTRSIAKQIIGAINPLNWLNMLVTGDARGRTVSAAAYNALAGKGADILVHPTFSITEKNYFIIRKFEATAEGYAGKYVNFRTDEEAAKAKRMPKTYVQDGVIVTPTGIKR